MSEKITPEVQEELERLDELDYERPHIYVCTPAYDGKVDSGFAQSVANASWHMGLLGLRTTVSMMGNSAFIELGRNLFVKFFLEDDELKNATHLFFVDSDLEFNPQAFVGLVAACDEDRPVVAGVYPRRQREPWDFPAQWAPHPTEKTDDGRDCIWVDEEGWLKCSRVPTGFLLIRRNVLEEMAEDAFKARTHDHGQVPWVFHTNFDEDGRFIGEDYGFCDDYVKKYGKMIDVWMGFEFVHGGYKGCFEEFLAAKIEEAEAEPVKRLGGNRG